MPKKPEPQPEGYTAVPPTDKVLPGDLYQNRRGQWVPVDQTDVGYRAEFAQVIRKTDNLTS